MALGAALERGLFWRLGDGPKALDDLAGELGMQQSQPNAFLAHAVPTVGDWHGDGFDDLMVAVTGRDTTAVSTGGVYLFTGRRWTAISGDDVRFLTQETAGIPSPAEFGEWWGFCCC